MANDTLIAWTRYTWNPWYGCDKISPGCKNCYMYTALERYGRDPYTVQRAKTTWRDPLRWQKAAAAAKRIDRVFTCSWSDFFHEDADTWRPQAWEIISQCPNLQFQILTKRPERIMDCLPLRRRDPDGWLHASTGDWGKGWSNVWLGVSVENEKYLWRVDELRKIPARVHFISAEPLLAPLPNLDLTDVEWLIVGGESGPGYRPMPLDWARQLRDKAIAARTAFFFKQIAAPRTEAGCILDGREWKQYPA